MKRGFFAIFLVLILFIACAPKQTAPGPTATPAPGATGTPAATNAAGSTEQTDIALPDDEFGAPDPTGSTGQTSQATPVPTQKAQTPSASTPTPTLPYSDDNGISLPEDVFD